MDETPKSTHVAHPVVYGTGLIALDIVIPAEPGSGLGAWAGGTCGNVLAILAYLGWEAHPIARLNGDTPSDWVREDLSRWGVRLDLAELAPSASTPVIIQYIRRHPGGGSSHRFSWACPDCGASLPRYRAVTASAAEEAAAQLRRPAVFFLDRVSRGSLILAAASAALGAIVVFEPSGIGDPKLFLEALSLSHVVKYSRDRLKNGLPEQAVGPGVRVLIETRGEDGLRYRADTATGAAGRWVDLPRFHVPEVRDSAGSGDWCTAMLVDHVARLGAAGFDALSREELEHALRHGQAAAAWNCGFDGARGGMYRTGRTEFSDAVRQILNGKGSADCASDGRTSHSVLSFQGFCDACTA
jgi:fructokinase